VEYRLFYRAFNKATAHGRVGFFYEVGFFYYVEERCDHVSFCLIIL